MEFDDKDTIFSAMTENGSQINYTNNGYNITSSTPNYSTIGLGQTVRVPNFALEPIRHLNFNMPAFGQNISFNIQSPISFRYEEDNDEEDDDYEYIDNTNSLNSNGIRGIEKFMNYEHSNYDIIKVLENDKKYIKDDKNIEDGNFEMECPICFDDMEYCLELECEHHVCRNCVIGMYNHERLMKKRIPEIRCPLCRDELKIFSYLKLMKTNRLKLKKKLNEMKNKRNKNKLKRKFQKSKKHN